MKKRPRWRLRVYGVGHAYFARRGFYGGPPSKLVILNYRLHVPFDPRMVSC